MGDGSTQTARQPTCEKGTQTHAGLSACVKVEPEAMSNAHSMLRTVPVNLKLVALPIVTQVVFQSVTVKYLTATMGAQPFYLPELQS